MGLVKQVIITFVVIPLAAVLTYLFIQLDSDIETYVRERFNPHHSYYEDKVSGGCSRIKL